MPRTNPPYGRGGREDAVELWDENQRLRRQREILKKAVSILAEDPQLGMR